MSELILVPPPVKRSKKLEAKKEVKDSSTDTSSPDVRMVLIPHAVIHPDRICCYNEIKWMVPKTSSKIQEETTDESNADTTSFLKSSRKHSGVFSTHAKRKISKAIDYLIITSTDKKVYERLSGKYIKFKIAFVTLTLPSKQIHTDKELTNECFNQLLTELRKYHNVSKYVWRAEKQANGNLHYHLLTDCFIPWYELKNRWNRILNKLGYVDRYQEKNGNKQPNSTDIHSTRKIKNVKKYVTKYMTKTEFDIENNTPEEIENQIVNCRLWSCSQNLSNIKGCDMIIDNETEQELKKVVQNSKCHSFHSDYFSVYYINFKDLIKNGSNMLFNRFIQYLTNTFEFNYQLKLTS